MAHLADVNPYSGGDCCYTGGFVIGWGGLQLKIPGEIERGGEVILHKRLLSMVLAL